MRVASKQGEGLCPSTPLGTVVPRPHLLKTWFNSAFDLLLPPNCLSCDTLVAAPGLLCAECFRKTAFITDPFCLRCATPFTHASQGGPDRLCPDCRQAPPRFDRARAALRYDGHTARIVLALKYADRTETAAALARHMARAGSVLLREADVLIPVPLHRRRLLSRRYNQAALLAYALRRLAQLPVVPDALQRVRSTPSLGDKSGPERALIMEDAIAVRRGRGARIAGRRVLLIDDVLTSGATANACAEALKRSGARAVDVLVAARVPDPGLG